MKQDYSTVSNYQFGGKRVRFCGRAMSRYDLACAIDSIKKHSCFKLVYDIYYYDDLVYILKHALNLV